MIQDELEALFFDYLQVGYWISVWHFVNVLNILHLASSRGIKDSVTEMRAQFF